MGIAHYLASVVRKSEDPVVRGINLALERMKLNAQMPRAEGPDCGDGGGFPYGCLPPAPKPEEMAKYVC